MELTLDELRHIMATMNGGCIDIYCQICATAREKLEDMIDELEGKPEFREVSEEFKRLGVVSIEVIRGKQD